MYLHMYVCSAVSSCPCLSCPAFPPPSFAPPTPLPPHLTLAGPTPTNISRNSEPEMLRKGTPASPAVALASKVFPVPGGPDRMAPCKPDEQERGIVLSGDFTALATRVDLGCPQCPLHSPLAPRTTCTTWQGNQQVKTCICPEHAVHLRGWHSGAGKAHFFHSSESTQCVPIHNYYRHTQHSSRGHHQQVVRTFGILAPKSTYFCGCFRKVTNSMISCLASSHPATSLQWDHTGISRCMAEAKA